MNLAELEKVTQVLKQFSTDLMASSPLPGGTVALITKDGVAQSFAFGHSEIYSETPTKLTDKYEIGSISKVYTALAIFALIEDGKVKLDDQVTKFLPWFVAGIPDGPVTISQLLSHTAGFALGSDHLPDELAQVFDMRNCRRAGIGNFHYSNLGFMVLGQIIESITGTSVGQFLKQRILDPMGTSDVRVPVVTSDLDSMAVGHWPKFDQLPWRPGDPLAHAPWFEIACADGNIAANANELAALAVLIFNQGKVGSHQVLNPESINSLCSAVAPTGEPLVKWGNSPGAQSSRYGHGINVESISGNHVVTHGGGMVGYSTFFMADISAGAGIAVLTNSNGEYPAAQLIARVGHSLMLNAQAQIPDPDSRVKPAELTRNQLGTFYSGDLVLEVTDAGDYVKVSSGGSTDWLYRTWNDRFVTGNEILRTFHLYPVSDGWHWGSHHFTNQKHDEPVLTEVQRALVGHYRCFSPWFTNFRIVAHSGKLFLVAPGGVEATTEECELVELQPGNYRIGINPNTPETLIIGPLVNGKCAWVNRDGAIYSRTLSRY